MLELLFVLLLYETLLLLFSPLDILFGVGLSELFWLDCLHIIELLNCLKIILELSPSSQVAREEDCTNLEDAAKLSEEIQ